jgi:hypothetical protein
MQTNDEIVTDKSVRYPDGSFIWGTPVHTKEGLRPIETIKVGDYVLSKPEDGTGGPEYKPVTRILRFEDAEIWFVDFTVQTYDKNGSTLLLVALHQPFWSREKDDWDGFGYSQDVVALNRPFWVEEIGWLRADEFRDLLYKWSDLGKWEKGPPKFALANGARAGVDCGAFFVRKRFGNARQGWCNYPEMDKEMGDSGFTIDLYLGGESAEHGTISNKWGPEFDENHDPSGNFYWPAKENSYRATVHNLEVEDFHTYFVGTDGVWVHDASLQSDAITEGIFRDKWGRRVQW